MTRKGNVSNHLDVPNTRECAPPMHLGSTIGKLEALALFTSPRSPRLLNASRIAGSSGNARLILLAKKEAQ